MNHPHIELDRERTSERAARLELSLVVPMFEEEDNVWPLFQAIDAALSAYPSWEVLFVDDGSSDATLGRLVVLAERYPQVRVVALQTNAGQTPAMVAGIEHAHGETIITMDGDLQNDPADIPAFLREIEAGYDIVVGYRVNRQDKFLSRKLPSYIANRLIGWVTNVPIRDNGCSLKAYRRSVIQNIPLYSELHRFIPAMASLAGSRLKEIPVRHHARIHGESKYGLSRTLKVILDLVVVRMLLTTLGRPIKLFAFLGVPPLLLSMLFVGMGTYHVYASSKPSIFFGASILWFMFAGFSLSVGILAELFYSHVDYRESQLASLTKVYHG
ncbi:MAG: glycosyltransferase family 2 protein [Pseudomonadota bacterium]